VAEERHPVYYGLNCTPLGAAGRATG
jgi:hypothetical protein